MGVLAKVTVFWNTWKWDSLVVGIPKCFNIGQRERRTMGRFQPCIREEIHSIVLNLPQLVYVVLIEDDFVV